MKRIISAVFASISLAVVLYHAAMKKVSRLRTCKRKMSLRLMWSYYLLMKFSGYPIRNHSLTILMT